MDRLLKPFIGAVIGGATAGGWLIVDLLLPEPIGDYLLFFLMGLVNIVIGWQVGRLLGKQREAGKQDALESVAKEMKANPSLSTDAIK